MIPSLLGYEMQAGSESKWKPCTEDKALVAQRFPKYRWSVNSCIVTLYFPLPTVLIAVGTAAPGGVGATRTIVPTSVYNPLVPSL